MPKEENHIMIHGDTVPNLLKMKGAESQGKEIVGEMFTYDIDELCERYKKLPAILVQLGKYSKLLTEARQLYIIGHYYSCIAMCGVTVERIIKEIFVSSIMFKNGNEFARPNDDVISKLETIDMSIVYEIMIKSGIVDKKLRNSFKKMVEMRNRYVHGRVNENEVALKNDSIEALEYLHTIVEGTVSVFKDFTIIDGKLVKK